MPCLPNFPKEEYQPWCPVPCYFHEPFIPTVPFRSQLLFCSTEWKWLEDLLSWKLSDWRWTWHKHPSVFCLNIIGESVGFFKAAVIWVLFGGLLCFVLQFHSILDQSFSLSSLLWNIVNTNLKERVREVCKLSAEKN